MALITRTQFIKKPVDVTVVFDARPFAPLFEAQGQ
jgi:hypothetical protein